VQGLLSQSEVELYNTLLVSAERWIGCCVFQVRFRAKQSTSCSGSRQPKGEFCCWLQCCGLQSRDVSD